MRHACRRWSLWSAALLVLLGCRTTVSGVRKDDSANVYVPSEHCMVHDYVSSAEVPSGARPLGTVFVARAETDEETYVALRQAICDKGGDALSNMRWVFEPGEKLPSGLQASAWASGGSE